MNEDYSVTLERHEQMLKSLQKQLNELKELQKEIKVMNESLVIITNEIKHTNVALSSCEEKINKIQNTPKDRWEKVVSAVISSVVCGVIGYLIAKLFV